MLTQLDNDFFDELYQRQQAITDQVHYRIDIASVSLSVETIAQQKHIIFFPEYRDGWDYQSAAIDYDGVDCFLLSSLCHSPHQPEIFIQGSSLFSTATHMEIINKVLTEFSLTVNDILWVNPGLRLPIEITPLHP